MSSDLIIGAYGKALKRAKQKAHRTRAEVGLDTPAKSAGSRTLPRSHIAATARPASVPLKSWTCRAGPFQISIMTLRNGQALLEPLNGWALGALSPIRRQSSGKGGSPVWYLLGSLPHPVQRPGRVFAARGIEATANILRTRSDPRRA